MCELPPYFTDLQPFRQRFADGAAILMYHKLGPRPRRVRLKGLYLSAQLFARQLAELRAAGFRSGMPGDLPSDIAPSLCLSFDDGYANVLEHGLGPLAENGFQAIQYIVAGEIGGMNLWDMAEGEAPERLMDAAQIRDWLAAGHRIGSHGLTHPWLTRISPHKAREEITSSKKLLEDRFGLPIEHFCYPYGDWNLHVRDWVREAGYRSATTTAFGIGDRDSDPFALGRVMVRYRSRSPRAVWARVRRHIHSA